MSVSCVRSLALDNPAFGYVLLSTASDGQVKLWRLRSEPDAENGAWRCTQTLELKARSVAESVALMQLELGNGEWLVLCALGCVDGKVRVSAAVVSADGDGEFTLRPAVDLDGHEDWVRDLAFCRDDTGDVLLASASQDGYVRIWRFRLLDEANVEAAPPAAAPGVPGLEGDFERRGHVVRVGGRLLGIALEALLVGHEDWVYAARWHPPVRGSQPLALVTASADRTMMMWRPDPASDVWLNVVRVGSVGGHTFG